MEGKVRYVDEDECDFVGRRKRERMWKDGKRTRLIERGGELNIIDFLVFCCGRV